MMQECNGMYRVAGTFLLLAIAIEAAVYQWATTCVDCSAELSFVIALGHTAIGACLERSAATFIEAEELYQRAKRARTTVEL